MDPLLVDAALSIAHFAALLVMAGALSAELFILRLAPSAPVLKLLARVDMFYGLSSGLLIAAGVSRVFFGLKDAAYYGASHTFWAKIAVFVIIGLMSGWPTMKFIQWRRAATADENFAPPAKQWKSAKRIVMIEAHLLFLVIVFAALMARGIG